MGSHRRKWGWWLVAAIAVAVAASLFLHRKPAAPEASGEAGSADTASAVAVVRDTVYLTVDEETIPVVRERKVDTGKPRADVLGDASGDVSGDVSGNAPVEAPVDAPAAAEETVVSVPVAVLNDLVRDKSGRDITLTTQAPDRILLTYAGKVDVPVIGEQSMHFTAGFKIIEVKGDRLTLQIDSGVALFAPRILERLPAGLVDSYANGRAVVNLSAIPSLKKQLKSFEIVGFSLDEEAISLRTVGK